MNWKFISMLHWTYFNKGMSLTYYIKFLILLFGVSSLNVKDTLYLGALYGVASYILGLLFFRVGFAEEEIEVNNFFNRFVREVRKKFK